VDPAGGERRAHGREIGDCDERGALAGAGVASLHRVAVDGSGTVEKPGDGPVMEVGSLLRGVDVLAERELASGEGALGGEDLAPAFLGADRRYQAYRRDGSRVDQR